jgi:hypothetical protein
MIADMRSARLPTMDEIQCWDWMVLNSSANYAKNRSSFKTYRQIQGTAGGAPVIGIGTVELEVRRSPMSTETGLLILENVLHIPSALCNGFNPLQLGQGDVTFKKGLVEGYFPSGQPMWYGATHCGLFRLALAGNPQGETYLQEGKTYALSVFLSEEEASSLITRDTTTDET